MSSKPSKQHFLYLDFLRGVAALSVLLLHWLDGNGVSFFGSSMLGVDFFFVLSGFVMAYSYEDRLKQGYSIARFFVLRLIRLYPILLIGLCLGFARFSMQSIVDTGEFDPAIVGLLFKGLLLIPSNLQDGVVTLFPLNVPIWSLFFEIVAYAMLGAFAFRLKNWAVLALQVVALIGVISWVVFKFHPDELRWLVQEDMAYGMIYGFSRVTFSFFAGIMLFRLRLFFPTADNPKLRWGLLAIFCAVLVSPKDIIHPAVALLAIIGLFPAIIATGTHAPAEGIVQKIFKISGDISYPLYVIHVPIIWTAGAVIKKVFPNLPFEHVWTGLIILPATIVASYLVFRFYDKPVRAYLVTRYNQLNDGKDTPRASQRPANG